jgi:hypothetical protein
MNLNAPTMPVFVASLVLAVLALIGAIGILPFLGAYAVWIALIGYVVLAVGTVVKM